MEMEVVGTVTQVLKNNIVKVVVERKSACGGNCHDCSNTCGGKSEIFVKSTDELHTGDEVIIYERSKKVLFISLIVFLLPLLLMIIIYTVLKKHIDNEELVSFISLSGGIIVFLTVVLYLRKLKMPLCKKINARKE